MERENLEKALEKKALGYDTEEVVEEYQEGDGEIRLTKKKVTKKNVPPDITALKLLLDNIKIGEKSVEEMTDEELENEKNKLLELLNKENKNDKRS